GLDPRPDLHPPVAGRTGIPHSRDPHRDQHGEAGGTLMSTPPPPHSPHDPPHTGPLPGGAVPAGPSPYQQPASSRPPQDPRDGFFRALFDLRFERFITLKF